MRKFLFGLLTVVLFTACGDKTAYTITGTLADLADGTEVRLSSDRRGKDVVASTTIQGGKFVFEGQQPEAVVQFLKVDGHDNFRRPYAIVVEGGAIEVAVVDGNVSVTGTPLNDAYSRLGKEMAVEGAMKSGADEELLKAFVKENAGNVLGVALFEANAYRFQLDEMKEIFALVPEKFKSLPTMVKMSEGIAAREVTAVGKKFTDLKGFDPEGKEVSLSDYAGNGRVVLVDFWASWCPYCIAEMPDLVAAYAKYKDKGFEIVGVSLDDKNDLWKAGIEKSNATWAHISDLKGWESELSKTYAIFSLPQTVLIDKDGTIIDKQIKGADLDAKLAELFK